MTALSDWMREIKEAMAQEQSPDRYQDAAGWCHALADLIPEMVIALDFYADPYNRKDENGEPIEVPDFYDELDFGETARALLAQIEQRKPK